MNVRANREGYREATVRSAHGTTACTALGAPSDHICRLYVRPDSTDQPARPCSRDGVRVNRVLSGVALCHIAPSWQQDHRWPERAMAPSYPTVTPASDVLSEAPTGGWDLSAVVIVSVHSRTPVLAVCRALCHTYHDTRNSKCPGSFAPP